MSDGLLAERKQRKHEKLSSSSRRRSRICAVGYLLLQARPGRNKMQLVRTYLRDVEPRRVYL